MQIKPENPLVSVCVPTFNSAEFIKETLASICRSTYDEIEIIVNDDCSSDNTCDLVQALKDKRIFFHKNAERIGVPANWNKALRHSKGRIMCLLNHDDLISPFWIEYAVRILTVHTQVGWLVSAFHVLNRNGEIMRTVRKFPENRVYRSPEIFPVIMTLNGLAPGFVARKEVLREMEYFDETMGPSADNELFIRLSTGYPMFYSTTAHTSWRSHPDSLSHRWTRINQVRDGLNILRKTFFDSDLPLELQQFRNQAYLYFYNKAIMILNSLCSKGELKAVQEILAIIDEEGLRFHEINDNPFRP